MSYHYHHLNGYCGCYYFTSHHLYNMPHIPSIRWLPQVTLSAHTTILSNTSRTVLTQTFSNPSSKDAIPEATYTFPLYDGVGVVGFNCRIGKRVIRGLVKEKAKAKAVYDEAVARGETAGLLTQLPESSDVFTTKIGNIPAKEKVIVEITYFGELKHDAEADGIRFTIPTTIAPRYGDLPGGIAEPGSGSKSREAETGGGIQITVDVAMPSKSSIRGIQSPSHPIAVTMGSTTVNSTGSVFEPNKGAATLSMGKAELERDFILLVLVPDIVKPQALLESHPTIPNQRALMVTLVPKFALPPSKPEVVFIVDRSGSMSSNIPTLISALKVFLKSLPVGVKFNICSFGGSYSMLWKRSRSYDQSTLKSAISHVEKFSANMGGTEMFKPVKAVIENRYKDMALEVMLLTDGEIWNQQEVFSYLNKEVQESEAPIRIFTLGIGNAVSHSLIEGIARAGNGFSQAVGLDEKLDGKVVRMLKGGLSPHVKDYSLEVKYENDGQDDDYEVIDKVSEGFRILGLQNPGPAPMGEEIPQKISLFSEDVDMDMETTPVPDSDGIVEKYAHLPEVSPPKLLQSPNRIPPLFPFSRTVVYLLMSPQSCQLTPKSVVLKGTSSHGPLELEIPVQVLPDKAETIHQLAARKAIGELEEGRGWIFDAKDEGGVPIKERFDGNWEDIVEREGVRLGVEFQVGGKWCSFVAVESNDTELAEKGRERMKATERRDSEKVLIANHSEEEGYELLSALGGAYAHTPQSMPADDARSVASSAISTGTFTDASTISSNSVEKDAGPAKYRAQATPQARNISDSSSHGSIKYKRNISRGRAAYVGSRGSLVNHSLVLDNTLLSYAGASSLAPQNLDSSMAARGGAPTFHPPQRAASQQQQQTAFYPLQIAASQQQQQTAFYPPQMAASQQLQQAASQQYQQIAPKQYQQMAPKQYQQMAPQQPARRMNISAGKRSPTAPQLSTPAPAGPMPYYGRFGVSSPRPRPPGAAASRPTALGAVDQSVPLPDEEDGGAAGAQPPVGMTARKRRMAKPPVMGFLSKRSARKASKESAASLDYSEDSDNSLSLSSPANPANPTKLLHQLIDLQSFGGSWDLTGALCVLLGITLDDARAKADKHLWTAWATILAVVFCEVRFQNDADVWDLVVDKAREWLREEAGKGVAVEGLEGKAREILGAV
ncbi:MAG: hypothetical protein M1813_000835 [Trichoglossum hirsutum]|nr:MAG: hypothetical protein M1813_000835 [Trichoglossum hirsutum]